MTALVMDEVRHGSNLAGFSLELQPGEVVVISGGSGKFRLLQMALGMVEPDHGTVRVLDRDPFELSRAERRKLRARCAWVPDRGALISNLSIRANVELPLRYHGLCAEDQVGQRAGEAMAELGITSLANLRPASLNTEERRLAALARARAVQPELLLLQDPFEGLGDRAANTVVGVIDGLTEWGCGTVITTNASRLDRAYGGRLTALRGARIIDRSKVSFGR